MLWVWEENTAQHRLNVKILSFCVLITHNKNKKAYLKTQIRIFYTLSVYN